jgi:hemolysin type calcium-binding protein
MSMGVTVRRGALFVGATCLLAAAPQGAAARSKPVLDVPLAFQVHNTNTSGVPCPSDGGAYTVRGRLVGPRSALDGPRPRAVAVYLHGFNTGGFMWRPPGAPLLDQAAVLARLGHVSLVVDTLGYDRSDHPHGSQTCLGSAADVTHQLVEKLRSGDYAVRGGWPTTFSKVVLVGHDSGATIADIEAYSYRDIDGLVHFTWADQGFTDTALTGFAELLPTCARGGDAAEQGPPARSDPAGGPSGYVFFLNDAKVREEQRNTDPRLVGRLMRLWNRNPCGEYEGVPESVQVNMRRLPEIQVPILYGYGELEFLWTPEGLAQQADLYRGSSDLTTVVIRRAGHFPMFSRVAPVFQSTVAEWLRSRRFLSARALTSHGCPAGSRTTVGGTGVDRLRGTAKADNLIGRGGRDRLSGRGGADCLKGGSGADRIWGGPGRDLVSGAGGRDRIAVADGQRDRVRCGGGRDRVRADRVDVLSGCESVRRSP